LHNALLDFRDDPEVWVSIISGAGDRAFSSGHDLKEDTVSGFEEAMTTSFWRPGTATIYGTLEIWKPIIAAIHGYCLAGGLELALACDMRIAADNAQFGMSEVLRALVPGGGGVQRLPRIVPLGIAMELLLTRDMIDAQEAYRIGLVNKVVPLAELLPTAEKLARKICDNGPLTVRAIKESAIRGLDVPLEYALRLNATLTHINHTTEDSMEGPRAFIEKRKPVYKGR
jgi:E-phenylitaconyl-CoA hydratase